MEELDVAPLAKDLNDQISEISPPIFDCLSTLGKKMFYPAGILAQGAEAKHGSPKFNATIGIALENGHAMHLAVASNFYKNLTPDEIFPYAPPDGLPELRQAWKEKLLRTNPSLEGKHFSLPMVTNALTNGLSLAGDLLTEKDDTLILPDKFWGQYNLNFGIRLDAKIVTYEMFDTNRQFNIKAFSETVNRVAATQDKLIVSLNFPNNPTGYTPSVSEAREITQTILNLAEKGTKIVTIIDDAYFGLFFEDSIKESLFGSLCNLHENIFAVKVDGATKESFAWGFRTGFLTVGTKTSRPDELYAALETKIKGLIRSTISSSNHASQEILVKMLKDSRYETESKAKFEILKSRALRLKAVLSQDKYKEDWECYPFNSGYFMCLKLTNVNSEELRCHLNSKYGVGTIAIGETDLRIAFSCIEEENIEELIDLVHQGLKELS